jgi:glycosyltransferase involved in cell wall biosynthesis
MAIKVSVVVLTYNHELYIAKALDSILSQEVDFELQIIVADDGSQDRTLSIVDAFAAEYPDKFLVLKKETNQGVKNNVFTCIERISGEYIAILDGDDYWVDNHKLKKQVEFLIENQDFNGVFHDAQIIHIDEAQKVLFNKKKYYSQSYVFNEVIFPSDLISREMILPSSSALLRGSSLKLINKSLIVDNYSILWKLTCFSIKKSKFYFINEPMSVYHNHSKGISKSDNEQFHLSQIKFLKSLLKDDFYQGCQYDIYSALTKEFKILLNSKKVSLNKRKLFRSYLYMEIRKLQFYKKELFNK